MKLDKLVIIALSSLFFTYLQAQSDFGTWTSVSVEKKIHKWNLEAETELRTIYGLKLIDRWSLGLNATYEISKPISIGVGYQFMNTLDTKYLNYQLRHRLDAEVTGKKKWSDFVFSLTEGVQLTTKDDHKRIKNDGSVNTYKINPAWVWKNAIKVAYDIPNFKLSPGYELETYYELNNPDGNSFDKIRHTLYAKYRINKSHSIKLFGTLNNELGEEDDIETTGKYILGLKYSFKF